MKFLSKIYLNLKQKNLNNLESRIQASKRRIENEKQLIEHKKQHLQGLLQENAVLKNKYETLMNLFEIENKNIIIENHSFNLSAWENVFIKKKYNQYVIQTKNEQEIYTFDSNLNDFLDYLCTLKYSIIVLSVDSKNILLQFRMEK